MIRITWYSGQLVVTDTELMPDTESPIETSLIYTHKSLVPNPKKPWIKDTVREKVKLARELPGQTRRTFTCYQGFLDRVIQACNQRKLAYEVHDLREKLPPIQMQLMHGFWHSQFSSLIKFLSKGRSGILKLPTRFGKSSCLLNIIRAYPNVPTVVAMPGVDLLNQACAELRIGLPGRTVSGEFSGAKKPKGQCDDVTVCSLDSLEKINPEGVKLLLIDEPHAIAAPSRILNVAKFQQARIYGFGATTTGRFDGGDALVEGLVGPVLFEKTFSQAVKEGAICPITVYMVEMPFEKFACHDRDSAYRQLVYRNPRFMEVVQQISNAIPLDWQTLIFADQMKQIDLIATFVEGGTTAIASRMSKKERDEKFASMKSGDTKRCIATGIYAVGTTFPDLRCIINAAGGGGSITGTQKPGRLAQRRPGKKCGYMIDFLFVATDHDEDARTGGGDKWISVIIDCQNRLRVYRANGYTIKVIKNLADMRFE
jgi:superfamily II DNA or RNA helicase